MLPKNCPACKQKSLSYNDDFVVCTNCPIYKKQLNFFQKPLVWANGRHWWWRLPIFIWFVIMLIENLQNPSFALNRLTNPFSALDLGIHELGHVIFSPFGVFMHIAGGSLFQCLFPLLWLIGLLKKKWYFAASLCFCWLALNLFDVAAYVADASARLLPLSIGPGIIGINPNDADTVYDHAHDWYQLLSRTNHLNSDLVLAHGLRVAAGVVFFIGLVLAFTLLIQMMIGSSKK